MKFKYRKFFISMFLLVIITGLTSLISPILLNIWSRDLVGFTKKRILILLIALLGSLLLEILFTIIREKFAKDFNINNFKRMISKFFILNYDETIEKGPTNLIERIIIGVNSIYNFATGDYIMIWSSILVMLVILVMVFLRNKIVMFIMLSMIPINYFGFKMLNKELLRRSETLQKNTAAGWQKILSIASQTDYLKQSASYDNILNQMEPTLNNIYGSMADVNVLAQSASKFIISLNQTAQTMIMVLIVYQILETSNIGISLVLFTILLPIYFQNLGVITNANLNKRDMRIAMSFLNEWDNYLEQDGTITLKQIDKLHFDIPILKIKDKELAKNIKGDFKKGDIVWVKGNSGTGKSTLMKLLPKFRVTEGVYINAIDIREYSNFSVRSNVDYLSQNVPIIKGTLRENLFLNREIDGLIEEKLKKEPILKTILESKSFDTMIEESGSNLSGGEKQKIAIARALYDKGEILILDEITSNIDKASAIDIMNQLLASRKDKIIFIISHYDLPKDYANKELILETCK